MSSEELELVLEALRSAKVEIEAMESTYRDYASSGHLMEQLEQAIAIVEGHTNAD